MAVVAFQTQQQVDGGISARQYLVSFQCFAGTADNIILLCGSDSLCVRLDVVEVVTGYQYACQVGTGIAQSTVFDTHLRAFEVQLPTRPTVGRTIGNSRIVVEVEALLVDGIADGRRGESMEAVNNEYRLLGFRVIVG